MVDPLIKAANRRERWLETHVLGKYNRCTYPQFSMMAAVLDLGGAAQMGYIADHQETTRGNLTGIVDKAESRGWVARVRDKVDRRIVRVVLSEQGRAMVEAMKAEIAANTPALPPAFFTMLEAFPGVGDTSPVVVDEPA